MALARLHCWSAIARSFCGWRDATRPLSWHTTGLGWEHDGALERSRINGHNALRPGNLKAVALWISARCADSSTALMVDVFRAPNAILAPLRGLITLRGLTPGLGQGVLYLPPEHDASSELLSAA